jgi:glucose-1-phosphate thymidylyltransferase
MQIVVFEDERVSHLYPITVGRPAYTILCGSLRLVDWLQGLDASCIAVVREHLVEIQRQDFGFLAELPGDSSNVPTLLLNARLVPCRTVLESLEQIMHNAHAGIIRSGKSLAAALLPPGTMPPPPSLTSSHLDAYLVGLGLDDLSPLDVELPLLEFPHDVVRYNQETMIENLSYRLESGQYREIAEGVFAAKDAHLSSFVVTDTKTGPILLDEHASIGPYAYLSGPAYVGPRTRVIEHASIKDSVSIGHTAKIGGEVEASVIESYTNKQHHGFMGHSYLGSWINLGAGTCNSDLKNTYGEVSMEYRGRRVSTGMQFIGCIIGDYSKSAINTGIFTGKTVGVCSMLYGFVTTNVPSFVNYARLFGQVTELPPDVMVATQRRMFTRREVTQRPCDQQLIQDMYELTRDERKMAGEPLSL